jgi:hypothetical protein
MGKNITVLIGLLIVGFLAAVLVWFLVYLPFRILQPVDFMSDTLTEALIEDLKDRTDAFLMGESGILIMSGEELSLLLKRNLQDALDIDITAISVDIEEEVIAATVRVRISDIPSSGYLTWIMTRREVEYTTTSVAARVWADEGMIAYDVLDFRIGSFRIPHFLVRRIMGDAKRSFEDLYIEEIVYGDGLIRVRGRR